MPTVEKRIPKSEISGVHKSLDKASKQLDSHVDDFQKAYKIYTRKVALS